MRKFRNFSFNLCFLFDWNFLCIGFIKSVKYLFLLGKKYLCSFIMDVSNFLLVFN